MWLTRLLKRSSITQRLRRPKVEVFMSLSRALWDILQAWHILLRFYNRKTHSWDCAFIIWMCWQHHWVKDFFCLLHRWSLLAPWQGASSPIKGCGVMLYPGAANGAKSGPQAPVNIAKTVSWKHGLHSSSAPLQPSVSLFLSVWVKTWADLAELCVTSWSVFRHGLLLGWPPVYALTFKEKTLTPFVTQLQVLSATEAEQKSATEAV